MIASLRREFRFGWYVAHGVSLQLMTGLKTHSKAFGSKRYDGRGGNFQALTVQATPIEKPSDIYGSIDSDPQESFTCLHKRNYVYNVHPG